MKIFPLKPLSMIDKAENLIAAAENLQKTSPLSLKPIDKTVAQLTNNKPDYNKKINLLGSEHTLRELRSAYKNARRQLNHDKFEKN